MNEIGLKEKLLKAIQMVSLTDLARKSGVSLNVLNQLKIGKYNPSDERAKHLLSIIYSGNIHGPYTRLKRDDNILQKMDSRIKELQKEIDSIKDAQSVIRKIGRE